MAVKDKSIMPWCPYTGAEGAKAVFAEEQYRKTIEEALNDIGNTIGANVPEEKYEEEMGKAQEIETVLYFYLFKDEMVQSSNFLEEARHRFNSRYAGTYGTLSFVKNRICKLKTETAFARCKGERCPKAQLVKSNDSKASSSKFFYNKKYLFCGGTWLPDQND